MADENLTIWDALGKTDPKHTKPFKRAGGFTGTAVKPIYTAHKMTEQFGPAGKGWGMGEPSFQIVPGHNGEVMVYCTVGVWWGNRDQFVYGVGGDKVVSYVKANEQYNRPERWENDDEAFKKAFTDAVGNGMKQLGMSADVHMGLFDDSKYVSDLKAEMAEGPQFAKPEPKKDSRALYAAVETALREAGNKGKTALRDYWTSEAFIEAWETFPEDWRANLTAEKDGFIASYPKPTGRVDPNEALDRQFAETIGAN